MSSRVDIDLQGEGGALRPPPPSTLGQDRPRLVVIEGIEISATLDPYLSLRALAVYSGCSVRWLRDRLDVPAVSR